MSKESIISELQAKVAVIDSVPGLRASLIDLIIGVQERLTQCRYRFGVDGWPMETVFFQLNAPITTVDDSMHLSDCYKFSTATRMKWEQCIMLCRTIGVTQSSHVIIMAMLLRPGWIVEKDGLLVVMKEDVKWAKMQLPLNRENPSAMEEFRDNILIFFNAIRSNELRISGVAAWSSAKTRNKVSHNSIKRYAREVMGIDILSSYQASEVVLHLLRVGAPDCFEYPVGNERFARVLKRWWHGKLVPWNDEAAAIILKREGTAVANGNGNGSGNDLNNLNNLSRQLADDVINAAARQLGNVLREIVSAQEKKGTLFYSTQSLGALFSQSATEKVPLGVHSGRIGRARSSCSSLGNLLPSSMTSRDVIVLAVIAISGTLTLKNVKGVETVVFISPSAPPLLQQPSQEVKMENEENKMSKSSSPSPTQSLLQSPQQQTPVPSNSQSSLKMRDTLFKLLSSFRDVMGVHGRWVQLDMAAGIVGQADMAAHPIALRYISECMPKSPLQNAEPGMAEALLHTVITYPKIFGLRVGQAGVIEIGVANQKD